MSDPQILIVDDEPNICKTLKKALESEGYEVRAVEDGENALETVDEMVPDVVLLDLKLPGMDGLEVLGELSDVETDVIMITGHGSEETAVQAMKQGAIDYLRKPFSPEEIREKVTELLQRRKIEPVSPREADYETCIELGKKMINRREFERAQEYLEQSLTRDTSAPEPFNLLGVIQEMRGETTEALKKYRAALGLDPTYSPAQENMDRAAPGDRGSEGIKLDEDNEVD